MAPLLAGRSIWKSPRRISSQVIAASEFSAHATVLKIQFETSPNFIQRILERNKFISHWTCYICIFFYEPERRGEDTGDEESGHPTKASQEIHHVQRKYLILAAYISGCQRIAVFVSAVQHHPSQKVHAINYNHAKRRHPQRSARNK